MRTIKTTSPADRFNYAVNVVLEHEGIESNDSEDPGGLTRYGITLSFLKANNIDVDGKGGIDHDDIKAIDEKMAKYIYKTYVWDKYNYDAINSLYLATKILDMAVNMGNMQAHKLVQRAVNHCGYHLEIDGVLGPKTLAALNEISLHGKESDLKYELQDEQKVFYEDLAHDKPKLKVFLKGWLKRAAF